MSVNNIDIIAEFEKALDRSGWTKSLLAQSVHVTQAAISNWIDRGSIPKDKLPAVADMLDDYDFRSAAAEYTFGVRVHSEARVQDTPQARYFSQAKEEDDRKKLDSELVIIFGKEKGDRTSADRRRVIDYLKELDEEIEAKSNYKASIMRDWGLTIKETN